VLITVVGLPAHPLLVHAVVVLVPLTALGAVAVALRPSWSRAYAPLVAVGALAGAVAAQLALLAGEQLEQAINVTPSFAPVIEQHGRFGLYTVVATWPFAVLATAAATLARRMSGLAPRIAAVVAAVSGLIAVVFTVLAGHSGSAAVWGHVAE
jgi:energy-converting hydrogenase Eha subunit A